jgi:hypothetical protein
MRKGLGATASFLVVAWGQQLPPAQASPPPPLAKGELLRFKSKPGDKERSKVKLTIEQETAAAQGKKSGASKPVVLTFGFGEEETVGAVDADGAARVAAHIVGAVGQGSAGTDPQTVDEMARALDELKVEFKRDARGEVLSLGLSGLRAPLSESTARQILNAVYGTQRGQLFPAQNIGVGGTWKTTMPIPSFADFEGEVHYDYTYARKNGTIAVILGEGRFEGKRAHGGAAVTQKLTGRSSAEYRFDVAAGKMLGSTVDQITQDEGAVPGREVLQLGVRQHIRVEWTPADKDIKDKEKAKP